MLKLSTTNIRAIFGGLIAALITGFGYYIIGNLSNYEAKQLIQSSLPGLNMLCNTIALASATILALLLTLLAVSMNSNSDLKDQHYRQVLFISKIDTVVFITAIIVFQLYNIPITESENISFSWYSKIYYASLITSSVLTGGLVTVVLLLYNTIRNMILILGLKITDHPLIYEEE